MATGAVDSTLVATWKSEIDLYERTFEKWGKRAKKIIKKYKDVRTPREDDTTRYNILWSNVQTRLPALYARDPKPVAERRFRDRDAVGRVTSDVLERAIQFTISHCNEFGAVLRQAILDEELVGRGTVWVRYQPHFKKIEEPFNENEETAKDGVEETNAVSDDDDDDNDNEELAYEESILDFVYWDDFGHSYGRTYEEVRAMWRRVYLTRDELTARFTGLSADEIAQIPLDWSPKDLRGSTIKDDGAGTKRAVVYEIWDKQEREVLWLCKGFPRELDRIDDPLQLEKFFPCPRPLYSTLGTDDLVPVPNYTIYQDQAGEIDDLSTRINAITKCLKVAGIRDTSAEGLDRLFAEGVENQLIPVDGWAALQEKGGLKNVMTLLPLQEIAETLGYLRDQRKELIEDVYQLTGIADIIRGNSDPGDTATAQQIKGQFACLRIADAQTDVQRFCRDIVRIMAQIIAGYDIATLRVICGVKLLTNAEKDAAKAALAANQRAQSAPTSASPPPSSAAPTMLQSLPPAPLPPMPSPDTLRLLTEPSWEDVDALLKNPVLREFRIDIETDSTIRMDEDADKASRLEFLNVAAAYLPKALELGTQAPELVPLLGEMFMFGVRGFRAARSLEQTFEDAMEALAKRPATPKPSPEEIKAQTTLTIARERAQLDQQTEAREQQAQAQEDAVRTQLETQRSQREAQFKAQLDAAMSERDNQHAQAMEALRMQSRETIAAANNANELRLEEMRQLHESAMAVVSATPVLGSPPGV
jgi:hypothetical protein